MKQRTKAMWIVVVTKENSNVWLYGQYQSKDIAVDVQKKVGGDVMTFDEYKQKYL